MDLTGTGGGGGTTLIYRDMCSCIMQASYSQPVVFSSYCVEPAISLHSHHVSLVQWTTCLLPVTRDPEFKSPGGYLCETRILLFALFRNIGDPDMIDHWGLIWGRPRPTPSLGPHPDNVIIPLDLTQLSCPGFMLAAGLPSGFTTKSWLLGGGSPVERLQSLFILTMSHWSSGLPVCFLSQGTGFKSLGGYLCETGILLLMLSHYNINIYCTCYCRF